MEEFVKQIEAMKAAGEEVAKIEAATTEEEVKLLDQIVMRLLPVMRYVDYPIRVRGSRAGHQFAEWKFETFSEKGILLVDKTKELNEGGDTRGSYEGSQLVLTRSGKLKKFVKEGEWSRWQNEGSYWEKEILDISSEAAIKGYGFSEIIKGISEEFKDAIKKAETKRQALNSRMEQIDKIKAILEA